MRYSKEVNFKVKEIFTVLRPAQEFFTYMETSILAYARRF
jgi:hypothetical protein